MKAVSPFAFIGAPRYHAGGFPGLAPDERPIIAQVGEEVLRRNDPRNRLNGGRDPRGPTVNMTINTPNTSSFRQSRDQIARDMRLALMRGGRLSWSSFSVATCGDEACSIVSMSLFSPLIRGWENGSERFFNVESVAGGQ